VIVGRRAAALALVILAVTAAAAPARTARDGRYSGRTEQRLNGKRGIVRFSVGQQGHSIGRIELNALYDCGRYGDFPTKLRIEPGRITSKSQFSIVGNVRTQGPLRRAARIQYFFTGGWVSHTFMRGFFHADMAILRGKNVVDRCVSATNWSAKRR
jgi:hypothetical protein